MVVSSFVTRFTIMVKLMVINVLQVCKNAIPKASEVANGFSLDSTLFGLKSSRLKLYGNHTV